MPNPKILERVIASRNKICSRLGISWISLANEFKIRSPDRRRFRSGFEAEDLWEWLEDRELLVQLPRALKEIERHDLYKIVEPAELLIPNEWHVPGPVVIIKGSIGIRTPRGGQVRLPGRVQGLGRKNLDDAIHHVRDWKKVHKIAEMIYSVYREFHVDMLETWSIQDDVRRESISERFESEQRGLRRHYRSLASLAAPVRESRPVKEAMRFEMGLAALQESLSYEVDSVPYANGLRLVHHVSQQTLKIVRIADEVIERRFELRPAEGR